MEGQNNAVFINKDPRYTTIRNLIEGGFIKAFRDIFPTIPKSVLAKDCGMNNTRFTRLIEHVEQFTLAEIFRMADLVGVDQTVMLQLVFRQWEVDQAGTIPVPPTPDDIHSQSSSE